MDNLFLAEERKRLGYKSKEIAELTGVTVSTQSNYENGRRRPDTRYLFKIAKLGFDLNYVVTGQRNKNDFSKLEKEFLELFRKAPKDVQSFVIKGLK